MPYSHLTIQELQYLFDETLIERSNRLHENSGLRKLVVVDAGNTLLRMTLASTIVFYEYLSQKYPADITYKYVILLPLGPPGGLFLRLTPEDLSILRESLRVLVESLVNSLDSPAHFGGDFYEADPSGPIGGGALSIKYNGAELGEFTTLHFMGVDVNVIEGEEFEAIIQIPPSSLPSNFNSNNGNTNPRPNNWGTTIRKLPDPLGSFDIGDWAIYQDIDSTNANEITYTSNNQDFLLETDATTFTAQLLGEDGVSILQERTITLDGNSDTNINGIRMIVSSFNTADTNFRCRISVTFDLDIIIGTSGRFSVKLIHDNEGTEYSFTQNDVMYDSNPLAMEMSNPTFSENTAIVRYVSGVQHYTNNSTFNINAFNINNINRDTYRLGVLTFNGASFGLPPLTIDPNFLTGWNKDYNVNNLNYSKTDWAITTNNLYQKDSLTVSSRLHDWIDSPLQYSLPWETLIDTFTNNRTRIYEDFRNENNRLLHDLSPGWDSEQSLDSYDDGLGLQVEGSLLTYPQLDFSTYNPNPVSQPDYTSLTGDRSFYGFFYHTNNNNTNGVFQLTGHNITEADITSKDVEIEITLNGVDWYTLSEDYIGGSLSPGDGCRVQTDVYNISVNNRLRFTLGTGKFTDASSNWGIWFKITIKESSKNKYMDSFEILDWV